MKSLIFLSAIWVFNLSAATVTKVDCHAGTFRVTAWNNGTVTLSDGENSPQSFIAYFSIESPRMKWEFANGGGVVRLWCLLDLEIRPRRPRNTYQKSASRRSCWNAMSKRSSKQLVYG